MKSSEFYTIEVREYARVIQFYNMLLLAVRLCKGGEHAYNFSNYICYYLPLDYVRTGSTPITFLLTSISLSISTSTRRRVTERRRGGRQVSEKIPTI